MGGKDRLPPDPQRSEDLPTEPGRIRRSILALVSANITIFMPAIGDGA
jgi:hypothetical protein